MAGLLQQFRFTFFLLWVGNVSMEITILWSLMSHDKTFVSCVISKTFTHISEITVFSQCSHIWVHWLKNSAITFNLYDKVLYIVASTVVFNNYDWMVWQINTKVEGMYAHTSCRNGKKNGGKCNVTFVKPSSNFWWSYHHKVALRAFWNTALATVNTGLQKVGSNFRINIILAQNWSWESEQRVRAESRSSTSQSDSALKWTRSWSRSLDSQLSVTAESYSWESELSRTEKWSWEYEMRVRDENQSWESEMGVRAESHGWESQLSWTEKWSWD